MTPIIEDASLDHLIPPEQMARIERERALWDARQSMLAVEFDAESLGAPAAKQIKWVDAAKAITERAESHPGDWVRLRRDAPTDEVAKSINLGRVPALEGLGVEAFSRQGRPRVDGKAPGWEIFARVRPE